VFELLFFLAGIGLGIVLYGVMVLIILLIVRSLLRKVKRNWLRTTLLICRPVIDLLVFFLIVTVALEIASASNSRDLPYIAGEVSVGSLPAAFVGFVLDVVGGIISVARNHKAR